MAVGVNLFLLSTFLFIPLVTAQNVWNTPPFLPGPERPEVNMTVENSNTIFFMDEEIEGHVFLAKINYAGPSTPAVGLYSAGTARYLGADIHKNPSIDPEDPDAWYLVITNRQDYETPGMQFYDFNVDIEETAITYRARVLLVVNNIDDNPPIIHVLDGCEIPELYVGLTNCTYRVSDIDGEISIVPMTFTIEGRRNEETMFRIHEERFNHTYYEMQITLEVIEELDFAISAIHILTITAFDSLPNNGSVTIVVQVEDVPNMPPRWVSIFAMQQFPEKEKQTFTVYAIDGDTQINKDIKYRLYKNETYTFFEIDADTGVLTVDEINRDALKQEIFSFEISAYKYDNITWETPFAVVMIVEDINDNTPLPNYELFSIDIEEETFLSLAFDADIIIEDIDLGVNAQYNVTLVDVEPQGASEAFMIIPGEGYQRQQFQITIVQAGLLDFELLDWQRVHFRIKAQELANDEHFEYADIVVNLINWNDELPIFEQDSYEEQFLETVKAGYVITTVKANDRDIDDEVHYSIIGSVASYLNIDKIKGVITVATDDVFDYQRQNEILVQVSARDTLGDGPYHTAFTQLTINLIDVNNKDPQINLPRQTPLVEENVPAGHLISDGIFGSDPDSTANITYSINWENSYATKQGRAADRNEYVNCVDILTVYPDENNLGYAQGILVARQLREGVTIDFEEFEVLYLAITLTDHHQEIGDGFSENIMAVMIEDLNDNPPVWTAGSLETIRVVREAAESGVIIGSVHATDIDGPLYNNVTYWLFATDDTPPGLVEIDPITGQLYVDDDRAIDADTPPRFNLFYLINATDCCFYPPQCGRDPTCYNTIGEIQISITDTNNKIPFIFDDEQERAFWIYENETTGYEIGYILAGDLDRDELYNQITYALNFREHQNLRNFFDIDKSSGRLHVQFTSDQVLDRDRGITFHDIYIVLTDNDLLEGDRMSNTNFTEVRVHLWDINDNAPELPLPSELSWPISENLLKGVQLTPEIYAPDIDEPDTDNSRVNYHILSLNPVDRELEYPQDLFVMFNPNNITGHLITNYDLKGYWGSWDIWIRAHDYGIPEMSTNETYQIIISPYNFHDPVFTFPLEQGQIIRLARERALPNVVLYYTNNIRLDNIQATDEDGLSAGVVTFAVIGNDDSQDYFIIENEGSNAGTLVLTRELPDELTSFELTIRATDQGTDPGPRFTDITVTIRFVSTQGDPVFEGNNAEVAFTEFARGLEESQQLPYAVDPKNIDCLGEDCHDIFYYIVGGDTRDLFQLEQKTNILRLTRELDRSVTLQHILRVAASNMASHPEAVPNYDSILNVYVHVKDSDPRPIFTARQYTGGITITDPIAKQILSVHATHTEEEVITYQILWDTMVADSSMQSVAATAFQIDSNTGSIRLNFQPQYSMSGMLEFEVLATDVSEREDRADVKIYLVVDDNRVTFRFFNNLTEVEGQREFIGTTITHWFGMVCNIDWILNSNDEDGAALHELTDVRVHFIVDNVAVDSGVIELKRSDISLMRSLRDALRERLLLLDDLNTSNDIQLTRLNLLQPILIVLATVLAIFCIVLIVAYWITTRRLKKRLEGLSNTKFGSVDSGLNRIAVDKGMTGKPSVALPGLVPGTNRHAIEGSNPVWNEAINAPDFDALSEISGDSDLIGIEDDPQFDYKNSIASPSNGEGNMISTRDSESSYNKYMPRSYMPDTPKNTTA